MGDKLYRYFVVDVNVPDDKISYDYCMKYYFDHDSYDGALDALNDKVYDYGYDRSELKIVRVLNPKI